MEFKNPIAVTLTLRQSVIVNQNGLDHWVSLTPGMASQNLRHFRNRLNKRLLGKKSSRFSASIPMIPVLEGTAFKRYHYHLLVDWPFDDGLNDIRYSILMDWSKTQWGYHQIDVQENADRGWINYITKSADKVDLASSIDWENLTAPNLI